MNFRLVVGRSRGRDPQDVEDGFDPVVNHFGIASVYPNPFNVKTQITFSLDRADRAILRVYDITGRKVCDLFDGFAGVGNHKLIWDASSVASSIYILRLDSGNRSTVTKVVLVR